MLQMAYQRHDYYLVEQKRESPDSNPIRYSQLRVVPKHPLNHNRDGDLRVCHMRAGLMCFLVTFDDDADPPLTRLELQFCRIRLDKLYCVASVAATMSCDGPLARHTGMQLFKLPSSTFL